MEEEWHKENGEEMNQENPDEEQVPKEEKPINPNSYIPVIEEMYKIFGEVFLDNKMEVVKDNKEVFDCTLLGVLFSAGWGSPCRIFYKDLINIYNQMNDGEKVFEIIQVSFDAKEEDFKKAISSLPWKFLPLNFSGINELKKKYNVLTIPKFFPIDKTGKSLSNSGREDLLEYGVDICEKWNEDARVAVPEQGEEQQQNENKNIYFYN